MIHKYTIPITVGSLGDFETEWFTHQDWENHNKEVERLKLSVEFGKTYDAKISMEHSPLLDDVHTPALTSHSFIIMDLSKNKISNE